MAQHWPVLLAAGFYASSGLAALAGNYWSTEQGGHGPIILITGLWLLWAKSAGLHSAPTRARTWLAAIGIVGCGLFSVVAAITAKQFLQMAGIWAALVALLYYHVGFAGLRRLWAPIAYLAFLIPPPEQLIVPLTHVLKDKIAVVAVQLLDALHYPVAREGVTLFIGPYEVVVAAACSGLNSLVSLLAIGLFYTYLMYPRDIRYALILSLLIVPVAVFANFVRVVLLLLITYHLGEAAAQSVLHGAMGMIVFGVACVTLVAIDTALHPWLGRGGRHAARPAATVHG